MLRVLRLLVAQYAWQRVETVVLGICGAGCVQVGGGEGLGRRDVRVLDL